MVAISAQKNIHALILGILFFCTLTIFPTTITHPYSVSKLIPLASLSLALIPFVVASINKNFFKEYKIIVVLLALHLAWSTIVLLVSQSNFTQELYGIWGRNNGFISHLSYLVMFIAAMMISSNSFIKRILDSSIIIGWIAMIYGLLQAFSLVSIESITGENNRSTSFFGNTNFHSAFIGFISTIALSLALMSKTSRVMRLFYIIFCLIAPFAIFKSDSDQGFMVMYVGFSFVSYAFLKTHNWKRLANTFLLLSTTLFSLVVIGFFQKGPFASIVYQESISSRGFYMRAGIRMLESNPLFGVGFDGYRDWYRRTRGNEALNSSSLGAKDISDSAHNYFIDIAASGGIILGVTLVLIWAYCVFCAFKLISQLKIQDSTSTALGASFLAFTTQLFISLPQIGLTVWGWIFGGLLISRLKSHSKISKENESESSRRKNIWTNSSLISLFLFIGGLVITLPVFISSYEYRKSVETQDVSRLINSALRFPREANMLSASGGALIGLEMYTDAKNILSVAIKSYPEFFEAWYLYSLLPNLTKDEIELARINMARLEPLVDPNG
jgi:O-antigen ligase